MVRSSSAFGPRARVAWRLALIVAPIALVAIALSGAVDPLQSGALTMLPALALAVMMLTRPYLGEHAIARLRARRWRHPGEAALAARFPRPPTRVVRGGHLIAVALAGRAPPCALAGCR
jgi:hypothetical protein